ncbi:MAG: AarF/ABC1/UbiB kinase family protein [Chloroflexi bacterium]|nr:AarF/ABC1/UbiB kinase family protein [Chloroflexota bacterium]
MMFQYKRPSISRGPHRKRYQEIISVFAHHGFGSTLEKFRLEHRIVFPLSPKTANLPSGQKPAVHFRLALEELGPTFIKIGQVLTTRPDLLGLEYIQELSKLQDAVPPEPWEKIHAVLVEEMGGEPEDFFARVDPVPLGSASLAQVHPAILKNGDAVVVKVQRPDIRTTIEIDLDILKDLAAFAQHSSWGKLNKAEEIVEEFASTLRNELDYNREGRNADRFRRNFTGVERLHIPKVYWEYTTERVLVMERLVGIKVDDIDGLVAAGYDRKKVGMNASLIIVKEVLQDGFYHADPHGGNLVVMPGDVIGAMDFGMVGELSKHDRQSLTRLYICCTALDAEGMVDELIRIGATAGSMNRPGLVRDLKRLLQKYSGLALKDIRIQKIMEDFIAIAMKHHLSLPTDLWLLAKTMAMIEGLGLKLDPDFDFFSVSESIVGELKWRMLLPDEGWKQTLLQQGIDWGELGMLFPRAGRRLLEKIDQDQAFDVGLRDTDKIMTGFGRFVNRLAVSILIAALILSLAILIANTADGSPLQLLIVAGFVAVVCLGIWLLISTLRGT